MCEGVCVWNKDVYFFDKTIQAEQNLPQVEMLEVERIPFYMTVERMVNYESDNHTRG